MQRWRTRTGGAALVDGIQRLAPAVDGGDDLIGISGPDEGLGVMVGLVEIAVDSGLEVDDRSEDAALQAPLGERGEEGLDCVEPMALRKRMNSWCRWRCMQRPMTVPSRMLRAAN